MAQGCAQKLTTLFPRLSVVKRTPTAMDGHGRTDALACVPSTASAAGAKASVADLMLLATTGSGSRVRYDTRGFFVFVRPVPTDRVALKSATSQADDDTGGLAKRPAAVLLAIYALAVAALCVGCAPAQIKTARPGIDQATGTAQTLQSQLDTIEYHANELRKEYK